MILDILKYTLDVEAAKRDRLIQKKLVEIGWIKAPVVDWIGTDSPDPRDTYTTRINGHVVGIHSSEEAARNHASVLESYILDFEIAKEE